MSFDYTTAIDRTDPINVGLVSCWTMAEGAGRGVWDLTGTSHGIANSGTRGANARGPGVTTSASVIVQGARPTSAQFPTGVRPRTIWGCARADSTTGWAWIGAYGHWNANQGWMIGRNGTTLVGSTVFTDITKASFWASGKTSTVALTYDGTRWVLYGDGAVQNSGTVTPGTVALNHFAGQNTGGTETWAGVISGLRIWNRALLPGEVMRLDRDIYAGLARERARRLFVAGFKAAWASRSSIVRGGSTL